MSANGPRHGRLDRHRWLSFSLGCGALLYLSLYVTAAFVAYLPVWHTASLHLHERDNRFPEEIMHERIDQLQRFYRHQAPLEPQRSWTAKETRHLTEVRGLLDGCFWLACAALPVSVFALRRHRWRSLAQVNGVALLFLAAILPFFGVFWSDIFHSLLFDNEDWKNNRTDISWHIMPPMYFRWTFALMLVVALSLHGLLWWTGKRREPGTPETAT
ncbi:MAG: DUF1461 domain-containing protein [Opitutales bacterium]